MPKIRHRYAKYMPKIYQRYTKDIQKIYKRYAKDIPKMHHRYAKYIPYICQSQGRSNRNSSPNLVQDYGDMCRSLILVLFHLEKGKTEAENSQLKGCSVRRQNYSA